MSQTDVGLFPALNWGDPVEVDGDFQLPVGTVTMLLADVEGSTRQWELDEAETAAAVAELSEIADEIVGRHDGVRPLEQGEGDSFVAAFARPSEAVACALAIQEKLAGGRLRVRIGIHSAEAQRGSSKTYVGPPLNRTARLRDAGHGGQVLLSRPTAELVADRLPDGAALLDLGIHRLRDLARPERIYQLTHPSLRRDFPPLRTLDTYTHNLPEFRTPLFGRHAETAEVRRLLDENRLVTLHGGGGCGKTRLAVHVAADALDDFPDGTFFVDLSPIADAAGVTTAMLAALGIGSEAESSLAPYLSGKRLLVVLDNCEHVVTLVAPLVDRLLGASPAFRVLATSREPLGVPGEVTYRVPSLSVPPEATVAGIDALSPYAAAELLLDRARRAKADFDPTSADAVAVADICRRLGGVPLAIELAAARVRAMTLPEIAGGLDERFRLLTGGARTALPRQQTLRASVDWSHDLLTEPERVAFRRLAVFAGGFTIEAARAVVAGDGAEPHQVLDLVTLLVDKSLVLTDDVGGATRYRLLETIRQYGLEQLEFRDEHAATARRHRDHFVTVADSFITTHVVTIMSSAASPLAAELDNLRAAYRGSLADADTEEAGRLACGLMMLLCYGRDGGERVSRFDDVTPHLGSMSPATRVAFLGLAAARGRGEAAQLPAIDAAADAAWCRNNGYPGRGHLMELLSASPAVAGTIPTATAIDEALDALAATGDFFSELMAGGVTHRIVEWMIPDADTAAFWQRWSRRFNEVGVDWDWAQNGPAMHLSLKGFAYETLEATDVSIAAGGVRSGTSRCSSLVDRARAFIALGRRDEAAEALDETARTAKELGELYWLGTALHHEGLLRQLAGESHRAITRYGEAIDSFVHSGDPMTTAYTVRAYSDVADAWITLGKLSEAASAIAAAKRLARSAFHLAFVDRARAALARAENDHEAAEAAAHAMLDGSAPYSVVRGVTVALELLGGCARHADSLTEATRLFAAAQALRDQVGDLTRFPPYQGWYEEDVAAVRDALGEDTFAEVWGQASEMPWREAVAYARRGRGERRRPATGWASLTPTELRVVELVAEGLSNKDIASRLFMSARTVGSHLSHVYTKLGLASRPELVAAAGRRRDRT